MPELTHQQILPPISIEIALADLHRPRQTLEKWIGLQPKLPLGRIPHLRPVPQLRIVGIDIPDIARDRGISHTQHVHNAAPQRRRIDPVQLRIILR
jgi:hypothetical protein